MEIIVDNVRFNVSAEDLENAQAEFSFWKGRRFTFCGKDFKEHSLRYNDILKAALAEDTTFAEGDDDKQRIYKALSRLEDRGYPYADSCGIFWMLCLKQLFGNIFRQTLVDQLNSKLHEEEIEELSTSEGDEQAPLSPFCKEPALLSILCKYASRSVFTLTATCKLFKEYIDQNPICKRDFTLLKEIFNLAQIAKFDYDSRRYRPEIEPTEMTQIESQCLLLIAEFLPKETHKITPPNKFYEQDKDYVIHQQRLATVLAGIDPKSALKVIASMDEERHPIQTFCAVAAIYERNPSLCDKGKVFAMAEKAYLGNAGAVLEALLKINSPLAKEFLEEMKTDCRSMRAGDLLVETTKRIGIAQLFEMGLDRTFLIDLLSQPLKLNFRNSNEPNVQTLTTIAKALVMLDQEKAVEILDLALNQAKGLESKAKVNSLINIVQAFAEFDQEKSFEMAQQALTEIAALYNWNKRYDEEYHSYRHSIFEFLHRVTRILLVNGGEYAIHVLEQNAKQMRLMDESLISRYLATYPLQKDIFLSFDHFPRELFMGAIEIYPQKAPETVKAAVEWARTITTPSRRTDFDLLKLSQILATDYPDQALEVANMIGFSEHKCEALLAIVSKGSSLHDID